MHKLIMLQAVLALSLALSGCGLKYDLYLPDENSRQEQSTLTLYDNSDEE